MLALLVRVDQGVMASEGIFPIPQNLKARASQSDGSMSHTGDYVGGGAYPSAEMQYEYSTAAARTAESQFFLSHFGQPCLLTRVPVGYIFVLWSWQVGHGHLTCLLGKPTMDVRWLRPMTPLASGGILPGFHQLWQG